MSLSSNRHSTPLALSVAVFCTLAAVPVHAQVERISVSGAGAQGNGQSRYPAISANGRYIVFDSDASNLVANDSNGVTDIFLRDRQLGTTTRVSVRQGGLQSAGASSRAVLSGDGSRIAFESYGPLIDSSNYYNCYLLDRSTGALQIVDLRADSGLPASTVCSRPSLDLSGTKVAFTTRSEVVAGDTNSWADVFVRDTVANTVRRVNLGPGNVQADQDSSQARLSANGNLVLFASSASNLVANDSNGSQDIFSVPSAGGTLTRINVGAGQLQANGVTTAEAAVNGDGTKYAFSSDSSTLPDWNAIQESTLYLRYPITDQTITASLPRSPSLQREGFNSEPDFSASGQFMVFVSTDDLLLDSETTGGIYLLDTISGDLVRISNGGNTGNVHQPRISADGSGIAWDSLSNTQVAGDTNGVSDVFYAPNPIYDRIFRHGFEP